MNLHEAISLYRLQFEANGRSEHTIAQAERHLRRFREWLGDAPEAERDVETVDATLVARFFVSDAARLGANGAMKKPTSMNAMRSSLRAFFGFLHDAGHVRSNPARLVGRARCSPPLPRAISDEDLGRLVDALNAASDTCAPRDRALIGVLAATGARVSSVLALDVEQFDLERREIEISPTKQGHGLRLPLPLDLAERLRGLIGEKTTGPIFRSGTGPTERRLARRHAARILSRRMDFAGIVRKSTLHGLRHAFAMRLYERTGDIAMVQAALGHRSISSTLVYAAPSTSRVSAAVRSIQCAPSIEENYK